MMLLASGVFRMQGSFACLFQGSLHVHLPGKRILPSAKMAAVHTASGGFEARVGFSGMADPGWALFFARSDLPPVQS